jgi:HEAT repeat protein
MKRASLIVIIAAATLAGVALAAPGPRTSSKTCEIDDLLAHTRGLEQRSPAYRKYMQRLLREAATDLPEAELLAAFEAEHDPARIEMLAAALAARTDRTGEPGALRAVTARAVDGADPRARAAATRALRGTSALSHAPDIYKHLVQDPSPEVRREAAENLVVDTEAVFGGQHGQAADTAVAAAVASRDPAVTARVLGNVSMSAIGPESAASLLRLLASPNTEVRRAAVIALGGVPASEAPAAREALLVLYRSDRDTSIRIAILESIARLGFASAIPDLESLRGVAPTLAVEVDEWIAVLRLGLQEWSLILRAKQLSAQART